jgi:hypothetical protein
MGGRASRRKGHDWERDVAELLRPIWPNAKRGLGQAREASVCDVEGTPCWIECKVGAQVSIMAAMKQALHDGKKANDNRIPLVIAKRDREEPIVTMQLGAFLHLIRHLPASHPLSAGSGLSVSSCPQCDEGDPGAVSLVGPDP